MMWNQIHRFFRILFLLGGFGCATMAATTETVPDPRDAPIQGAGEAPADPYLGLGRAVEVALHASPGLAEIRARAEAMAAVPSQAGSLPDPVISFGVQNLPTDSFDLGQEPMTQLRFGVSQQIPYPGKLALREKAAGYEADAAADSVGEARLRLVSDVKTTWWRLYYLDRALEIIAINQDLLRQFVTITETKYKVGQGLQQDVLLAQLELSRLLDQEVQLTGLRRNERSRINALLDRPAGSPVQLPSQEAVPVRLPAPRPISALLALAGEARPVLAQRQHAVDAARARRDLAEKDLLPDLNVGASYGVRDSDDAGRSRADFLSFQLSMNIPLFAGRKQKMAVSQRTSEWMERQYALQDEWAAVRDQVTTAVNDFERAREQFSLFETGIIPQARQTVASMLAGYQVNKVDFLNLVQAQITLYNYETRFWQAFSDANSALARLVAAVGEEQVHE